LQEINFALQEKKHYSLQKFLLLSYISHRSFLVLHSRASDLSCLH